MNTQTHSVGLIADIGGTNIRLGLVEMSPAEMGFGASVTSAMRVKSYKVSDFPHVCDVITLYLADIRSDLPQFCVAAVAGPVIGNSIDFTNSDWAFSGAEIENQLGIKSVRLINDFTAQAYALPHLSNADLVKLGGPDVGDTGAIYKIYSVLGPGTGLGVAGLLQAQGKSFAIPTEASHAGFAPVTARESEISQILHRQYGRVSTERILSGQGIVDLYQAVATLSGKKVVFETAEDISTAALNETDSLASETMQQFYAILGSVAGDMALIMGAQAGVYIAGGIAPRMPDFVKSSAFYERFLDKGRFQNYMAKIPVNLIVRDTPALLGCRVYLSEIFNLKAKV